MPAHRGAVVDDLLRDPNGQSGRRPPVFSRETTGSRDQPPKTRDKKAVVDEAGMAWNIPWKRRPAIVTSALAVKPRAITGDQGK